VLPPGSCDCHAHVFGPFDQYPLAEDRLYTPPLAPLNDYLAMLAAAGMRRGVLVQAGACGWDHRGTLAALRVGQGRLRGVAVPRPEAGDAELADMHAAGIRAIRFTQVIGRGTGQPVSGTHNFDRIAHFAPRLRELGWHAQLWANASVVAEHAPQLRALGIPLVLDHLGVVDVTRGVDAPDFQAVLGLVREGVAAVKLTAFRYSKGVAGYADVRPFHDALVAANPRQLLWGSDWPFLGMTGDQRPTVEGLTRIFCDWVSDAGLLRQILVDNPARIYGFD
jgi:predicted TIM-barrel fold metal-dependent hydrolase